jgi:proteic killer suppression protein
MIKTFRSKALAAFAETGETRRLAIPDHARRIGLIIRTLDAAKAPGDMNVPGFFFHPLKGKPQRYSVRATGNWRITFGFDDADAIDVDLEDYH